MTLKQTEKTNVELTKKLKIAMIEQNINQVELARLANTNQGNLSFKMRADNFRVNEYEKLVKALGCELEVNIILPNGKRV